MELTAGQEPALWAIGALSLDVQDVNELVEERAWPGRGVGTDFDSAVGAAGRTLVVDRTAALESVKQGCWDDLRDVELLEAAHHGEATPASAGLQQRLALHSRALRLHLDTWADEQERMLGLVPFDVRGDDVALPTQQVRFSVRSLGKCDDLKPLPRLSILHQDGCTQFGKQRASERSDARAPEFEVTDKVESDVNKSFAHRRTDTLVREELFTQAHVMEVMNSTPGLRLESSARDRLCARLGELCASCLCCRQSKLLDDVERSRWFNTCCNAAIMCNTILITYTAEVYASGENADGIFEYFETAFCCFYAAELLLRVVVHRLRFFSGPDAGWHFLDFLLVVVSMLEQLSRFGMGDGGVNLSYIRAVRMLRILKVLRVLRVMRAMKELRLLLDSILGSARSLLWSLIVMTCMTFVFALCFVQAASHPDPSAGIPARDPWRSVPYAMSVLFMAATGGIDWQLLADDLNQDGMHYYLLMFLYIGVFLFVIENALTSMFVEKLIDNVQHSVRDRLDRRIEYVEKIQGLFTHMDSDGDGEVSFEELCEKLFDPRMSAFAASLDIDEEDLTMCFNIITANGTHKIDADAFVVGCIKLRGQAKSVDVLDVCLTQSQIAKALSELAEEQSRFAAFCDKQFWDLNPNKDAWWVQRQKC